VARKYGEATGILGWSDHDALHTPLCRMNVALDARLKWHMRLAGVDPEPKKDPDVSGKILSIVRKGKKRSG
jgi:hypothetical protein